MLPSSLQGMPAVDADAGDDESQLGLSEENKSDDNDNASDVSTNSSDDDEEPRVQPVRKVRKQRSEAEDGDPPRDSSWLHTYRHACTQ